MKPESTIKIVLEDIVKELKLVKIVTSRNYRS